MSRVASLWPRGAWHYSKDGFRVLEFRVRTGGLGLRVRGSEFSLECKVSCLQALSVDATRFFVAKVRALGSPTRAGPTSDSGKPARLAVLTTAVLCIGRLHVPQRVPVAI